jgi:hypothetical protein
MSEHTRDDAPRRDRPAGEPGRAPPPAREPAPDPTPGRQPAPAQEPPETTRRPAPGIEHKPEPDGENLIPAKDRPGTL